MTEIRSTEEQLPEVRALFSALDAAQEAERKALLENNREFNSQYPDIYSLPYDEREKAYAELDQKSHAIRQVYRESVARAWAELATSSDPIAAWIAKNRDTHQYSYEIETVLTALPATIEELDELADRYDFCGVWDEFRDVAVEQGLIKEEGAPLPEALQEVADWAQQNLHMGRRVRRRFALKLASAAEALATNDPKVSLVKQARPLRAVAS